MEVGGVHHIALKAADVERVASFYRDVLGLAERARHRDELGLRSIWLSLGAAILMVERAGKPGVPRESLAAFSDDPPGLHLIALSMRAEDRERWRAHLAATGHAIAGETVYTLYTTDPEGNRVGLSSYPEPSRAGAP